MPTNIYLYKPGSQGGSALARSLGIKKIKHEGSRYRGASRKTVINWGASQLPDEVMNSNVINHPDNVSSATNKLNFFCQLSLGDTSIPLFTTDREIARSWLKEGKVVVARTMLRASSGRGIVLVESEEDLVDAPLYTQYIPKKEEYRIHVFDGEVLDVQRKARSSEVSDNNVNWKIRTHANGFIFARENVTAPQSVIDEAVKAVKAMDLCFGAVDVIYNEKNKQAYVLEVNTAPGLEGTTLENYTKAFERIM